MRKTIYISLLLISMLSIKTYAQKRVVTVDFESNSFVNNPTIPYNESFIIEGQLGENIEYVDVFIHNEGSKKSFYKTSWNRIPQNQGHTFKVLIPSILSPNSKYDFEIITYEKVTVAQKRKLLESLRKRISFYISNSLHYDGKGIVMENPKKVYNGLREMIDEAMSYQVSKNEVVCNAPSKLILNEFKKEKNFKFKKYMKNSDDEKSNENIKKLVSQKVKRITNMILGEITPFINTQLAQQYRVAHVKAIKTDKDRFTLPINVGMYAWNKTADINNVELKSTDFTLGAGITLPLMKNISSDKKWLGSLGISTGVLFSPIKDAKGVEFVTPGIELPAYLALGVKFFKVVRVNAGALIVGEKGDNNIGGLSIVPTIGLALELDLWLGIKK